ncbi:uncharacterized protein LOC126835812 [Adelges cooleyi]|uniref:uncharacterized protein LOC126835812 n=1 Tax=Adelges cooleyi TaxID=133065 RepID=UPI00217F7121|nr:uncharacterized protein LOC126835812 [Adelges cooleyi]
MFYIVSMDLLFLLTIIALASYSHQFLPDENDNQELINQLNKLLRNVGWSRINHLEVNDHDITQVQSFFSGIDLFIAPEFTDQCNVTKENVEKKYCMAIMLLGCVYANALHKFIRLITPLMNKCDVEIRRSNGREGYQRFLHNQTDNSGEPFKVPPGNYVKSCKLFNTVLEQFENSRQMFDYMSHALIYLVEPLKKIKKHSIIRNIIEILTDSVLKIRDINTTLYPKKYEYREGADDNIKKLHKSLKMYLNGQVKGDLCFIMKNHCILPKESHNIDLNQIPSIDAISVDDETTSQPIEDVVISQIKDHVEEVINKYFLDLGFQRKTHLGGINFENVTILYTLDLRIKINFLKMLTGRLSVLCRQFFSHNKRLKSRTEGEIVGVLC